jgi:threonine aldolase
VETNIVIVDLSSPFTAAQLLHYLADNGIKASAFGPSTVRFVTHLEVNGADIVEVGKWLGGFGR